MKRRLRTILVVVGIVVLVVVAFLIVFARGAVSQVGGRTCVGCVEWHWNGSSSIRAERISGEYRFTGDHAYRLRFDSGDVLLDWEPLEAGCRFATAEGGSTLAFEDAGDVRLEVPADEGCDGDVPPAGVGPPGGG